MVIFMFIIHKIMFKTCVMNKNNKFSNLYVMYGRRDRNLINKPAYVYHHIKVIKLTTLVHNHKFILTTTIL